MSTVWRQRTYFDARATAATVAISAISAISFLGGQTHGIGHPCRDRGAVLDGWSELTLRNFSNAPLSDQ